MSNKLTIDPEKLEVWIEQTFKTYKPYTKGYMVNTPFKEDRKFKLSISPKMGAYHCWKSDKSGPLWKLVTILDKCSKQEAIRKIYEENSLEFYDEKIKKFKDRFKKKDINYKTKSKSAKLPEHFNLIRLDSVGEINKKAISVLRQRKIDPITWHIGYCYDGDFKRRLIIPFFDKNKKFIYWIARSLFGQQPKYLNPPASIFDVYKEKVIFSRTWDFKDQDVIIVEGVFDAISLIELGFNAIAILGKILSYKQLEYITDAKHIIFGLDNDKPGKDALIKNMKFLKGNGFDNLKYIFPENSGSDWNESIVNQDPKHVKDYIQRNIRPFNLKAEILLKLKRKL